MDSSTRILVGIIGAVLALVILAIALPLLANRDDPEYPPNTAEGTVQRYIRAVIDSDADTALALLTPETASGCLEEQMRDWLRSNSYSYGSNRYRLGDIKERGADEVTVTIHVTNVPEPGLFELPIEGNLYAYRFHLERSDDGFWLIADAGWPFNLQYVRDFSCETDPTPTSIPMDAAS